MSFDRPKNVFSKIILRMIMKGFISLAGTLIMLTKVEETNKKIKKDKIKNKKCSNLVP